MITQKLIPVGKFDVCFSDAPWQEQRACMHCRREGAGDEVEHHHCKTHCKEALPVGIIDVCFSDAPWQGRHACMHRRREGAGVDVILKQQHLCLSVLVTYRAQRAHIVPRGIG